MGRSLVGKGSMLRALGASSVLALVCGLAVPESVGADGPTSWTAIQAPGNPGSLSDLTCPSLGSCVAIGGLGFETLSSGTWTHVVGSLPSNAGSAPGGGGIISNLSSLACSTASSCIAVGGYSDTAGAIVPLALTLSDGSVTSTEFAVADRRTRRPLSERQSQLDCVHVRWDLHRCRFLRQL